MARKNAAVVALLLLGFAAFASAQIPPIPGFISYPPSTEPNVRGGVKVTGADGFLVNVGPEPRFEGTMLDGRTAAQKKADGPPVPTPPGLVYTIEEQPVDVISFGSPAAGPAVAPRRPIARGTPVVMAPGGRLVTRPAAAGPIAPAAPAAAAGAAPAAGAAAAAPATIAAGGTPASGVASVTGTPQPMPNAPTNPGAAAAQLANTPILANIAGVSGAGVAAGPQLAPSAAQVAAGAGRR